MREASHSSVVIQGDLTIQAISTQVHEAATTLKYPLFHSKVHLSRPILRVNRDSEHAIVVKLQGPIMQLRLRVIVVVESLTFQPAEQSPLRRRLATLDTAFNGVCNLAFIPGAIVKDMVKIGRAHV